MSLYITVKNVHSELSALHSALSIRFTDWKSDSNSFDERIADKTHFNELQKIYKRNLALYNNGGDISDFEPYPLWVTVAKRKGYYTVKIFTSIK